MLQDTIKPFCKDNPFAQEMWPSFQGLGLHCLWFFKIGLIRFHCDEHVLCMCTFTFSNMNPGISEMIFLIKV